MKILRLLFPLLIIAAIFQRCQENELIDTYILDSENSLVEWCGHTENDTTTGILKFMANNIKAEKGRIKSGTITIPISTITDIQHLKDLQYMDIEQLKNADLLEAILHPTLVFKIKEVALLSGIHPTAVPGANWWIRGDMTMLGQTHQISFPAKIKFMANDLELEAKFTIDQTKWEMNHTSDHYTAENHLLPVVDLHLKGKARINNKAVI